MNIRNDAKKIAQRMVEAVCEQGSFKNTYSLAYEKFADGFGLTDQRRQICFEYLESIGCIKYKSNTEGLFIIMPQIVDFVECDQPSIP